MNATNIPFLIVFSIRLSHPLQSMHVFPSVETSECLIPMGVPHCGLGMYSARCYDRNFWKFAYLLDFCPMFFYMASVWLLKNKISFTFCSLHSFCHLLFMKVDPMVKVYLPKDTEEFLSAHLLIIQWGIKNQTKTKHGCHFPPPYLEGSLSMWITAKGWIPAGALNSRYLLVFPFLECVFWCSVSCDFLIKLFPHSWHL